MQGDFQICISVPLKLELVSFICELLQLSNLKLKVFDNPVRNAPNDLGNQFRDINKSNNNNDSNNNNNNDNDNNNNNNNNNNIIIIIINFLHFVNYAYQALMFGQ